MTFIEAYDFFLDMDKTESSIRASCTGYDKSKNKTESCKKQSVAQ